MKTGNSKNEFDLLLSAIAANVYDRILADNLMTTPSYMLSLYYILTYKLQPEWQSAYHESDVG